MRIPSTGPGFLRLPTNSRKRSEDRQECLLHPGEFLRPPSGLALDLREGVLDIRAGSNGSTVNFREAGA